MKHTVAIVDDHHLVRNGLVAAIENTNAYSVTLEAANGLEFFDLLRVHALPEIAVIDLHMPVMDGFQTLIKLRNAYPEIKPLVLTIDTDEDAIVRAIRSGARGFIRKNARPALFHAALDALAQNGYFHHDDISSTVENNPSLQTRIERKRNEILNRMTPRELEFLKLVCSKDEPTYEAIADLMGITKRTVDYYRQELFQKFDLKSKVGLVLFAAEHGLLSTTKG